MTDMITRCPSCDTSFRITEAQLQTAKGAVRCGACLHIFKAADHIVSDQKKAASKSAPQATPQKASPKASKPAAEETAQKNASAAKTYKAQPKFEYHKPKVPSPMISLIDDDNVKDAAEKEIKDDLKLAPQKEPQKNTAANEAVKATATVAATQTNSISSKTKPATAEASVTPDQDIGGKLSFDQAAIDNDDIVTKKVAEDDILISDDLPLEDDSEEKADGAYGEDLVESFLDLDSWKPKEKSLFDREDKPKDSQYDDEEESADESWAIDLLARDEDEGETPQPDQDRAFKMIKPEERQSPSQTEQEQKFYADENDFGKNDFIDEYSPSSTGSFDALDDDFTGLSDDNLGEPLTSDSSPNDKAKTTSQQKTNSSNKGDDQYEGFDLQAYNTSDDNDKKDNTAKQSSDEFADSDYDEEYTENFSGSYEPRDDDDYGSDYDSDYDGYNTDDQPDRKSILKAITPAPVEFHYRGSNSSWIRRSLWGLAILAGIGLLIAQIAWMQFDTLSRKQPYRDLYMTACPIVGCEVPPISVPALIKTTNFLVREHPSEPNALMVDTILLNTAAFEQPFPNLVLTFSDIQGKQVASRSFSPREYLGGEMAGKKNIPSNQPVHLALEIVNPGPDAVNYSAHIAQ